MIFLQDLPTPRIISAKKISRNGEEIVLLHIDAPYTVDTTIEMTVDQADLIAGALHDAVWGETEP